MQREVKLVGDITPESADEIIKELDKLARICGQPICLLINSPGGHKNATLKVVKVIKELRTPVHGLVQGEASSGAFVILRACTKKMATPDSKLMFHPPRVSVEEASRLTTFPCDHDYIDEEDPSYRELIVQLSEVTDCTIEELLSCGRAERVFSAQEAVVIGFIDQIYTE